MRVEFGRIALRFSGLASVAAAAVVSMAGSANAGEQIFDELRFGVSASVQSGRAGEDGVFPEVTALFDPFGYEEAVGWQQQLLHPRVHLGTSIGTSGEATQFFTGFTWTVDLSDKLFAEAGFGGVIHTGELDDNDDGPELGCRVLFHEYVGAGYRFTRNWNVMAQIAHSSHADLCDGPNDGITRAGVQIGYKF
ncbi:acyloxyacyl hydrolase [Rhizobium lentis]|uniref:acyloxyacyl hydrolase n=1 Tax=Rhizobium lentis TaxID=1138194 RepID=UPI001C836FEF|nr:acyloxyacyl hydrolase [Rhizobium lentis]MBX5043258.1 acyloxyacyl hydrolase [Rhizobium lentis]MBX5055711.1 acyloxyacyl hydrolase [Rhizobium lentis]MBX5073665.1 acyloxyacyl hydrolase [Rhizobium lentis]MBX5110829.1 acyloxyacyl hydrolase [Rhizobium lentis]MBX5116947.1 acyloxyacyl hydrolase [Rhizobium lentis]